MNNNHPSQKGHSIVKLIVLLALSSIFLFALGSLATTMKLANGNLKNKKNHNALADTMNNFYDQEVEYCKPNTIADNLTLQECENQEMALHLSIKEIYDDQ